MEIFIFIILGLYGTYKTISLFNDGVSKQRQLAIDTYWESYYKGTDNFDKEQQKIYDGEYESNCRTQALIWYNEWKDCEERHKKDLSGLGLKWNGFMPLQDPYLNRYDIISTSAKYLNTKESLAWQYFEQLKTQGTLLNPDQ